VQTPYLIVGSGGSAVDLSQTLERRTPLRYRTERFHFVFHAPEQESLQRELRRRIDTDGLKLRYEDGFMVRFPDRYEPAAVNKPEQFECPSHELDGFFSRVVCDGETVRIDGSGTYLQMLCSYERDGLVAFSNNIGLLVNFLEANGRALSRNEDFFANHLFNYSLAYYTFAGTPYREIDFHDSLETIEIGESVTTSLHDKFSDPAIVDRERDARIDLLHARLRHTIAEYLQHVGVETVGHNLTGGRDARTSFALFMETVRDRLEIVTDGFNYTHDMVIANFVSKRYGITRRDTTEKEVSYAYDYERVMNKTDPAEWFVPLFRKVTFRSSFNADSFVASGYLGNVLTFAGSERNQVIQDNRFKLRDDVLRRLQSLYAAGIETLREVYGDDAHAMFNLMYNTTNKIASVARRLSRNTICIFETDVFQACYLLEPVEGKRSNSLHYELMKRSNPDLLTAVPFEANKSFGPMSDTFELQNFQEAAAPRPYKCFMELNLERVVAHLREHSASIEFVSDAFFDMALDYVGQELPPLVTNKLFALLGTLEFKGISFRTIEGSTTLGGGGRYTIDFFENLYLQHQLYASGLGSMVYSDEVVFKSYIEPREGIAFRVVIKDMESDERLPVELVEQHDGHLVRASVPRNGKYGVFFSEFDRGSKTVSQLYRTNFIGRGREHRDAEIAALPSAA